MRNFIGFSVLALILSTGIAHAQQRGELFGGYQYSHQGSKWGGWNAAFTGNVNSWLGLTADFSGHGKFFTSTFGPTFSANLPRAKPFVHALFGADTYCCSSGEFVMMVGGGVDVGHGILGWRVVQGDWIVSKSFSGGGFRGDNGRISTGIIVRF
jgi:hypothetical protein